MLGVTAAAETAYGDSLDCVTAIASNGLYTAAGALGEAVADRLAISVAEPLSASSTVLYTLTVDAELTFVSWTSAMLRGTNPLGSVPIS